MVVLLKSLKPYATEPERELTHRACTDDGAVSAKEYIVIEYFLITSRNERGARIQPRSLYVSDPRAMRKRFFAPACMRPPCNDSLGSRRASALVNG